LPDIPASLRRALTSGQVIPFVGAGVSMSVRELGTPDRSLFPSWKQLLLRAADRLDGNGKGHEAGVVRGLVQKSPPNYLESARWARDGLGADWFPFLTAEFDPPINRADPGSFDLARAVWSLNDNIVITTNYDRVLHWTCPKLQELGYWDIEAPAEQSRLLRGESSGSTVWHLHGSIRNATQIILTPDGYQTLYHDERAGERMYAAALATLRTLLNARTFLFIGFSLDDAGVAAQLDWIARTFQGAAGPHFVLAARGESERMYQKLQSAPGVEIVTCADIGAAMVERIRELAAVARPGPAEATTAPAALLAADPDVVVSPPATVTSGDLLARSLLTLAPQDALPPQVVDALFEAFAESAPRSPAEHNLEVLVLSRRLYTTREPAVAARLERLLHRADLLPHIVGEGHHMLGWAENRAGRFGAALAHFDVAMTAAEASGSHGLCSRILNTAGYAHRAKHSYAEATQHFTRSFELKQRTGDVIGLEMTRQALGWLAAMRGRFTDAWRLFGEGIDASIACLTARPDEMSRERMHALVDSLAYHVIGRCTLGLLLERPASTFEACRDQCEPWLESVVVMSTTAGRALYREANAVLRLGLLDPLEEDVNEQGFLRFWALVGHSVEDPRRYEPMLARFVADEISRGAADIHIKLLAGTTFASRTSGDAALATLHGDVVSRLREGFGYDGIPDLSAQRRPPESSIHIDSSTWSDWGPLRHKRALLHTPGAFVGPAATEHYLQLLAWMSMVLLASEGGVDRHDIYALVDTVYPDGPSVRLNLGQSFGVCHRVSRLCHTVSPSGQRLQRFWEEEAFWSRSPYASRSELAEERNSYSHAEDQTHQRNRAIVERHVALINLLVEPLQRDDLPRLACSERRISAGDVHPAVLVSQSGDTYDCGALLMMHARRNFDYYVPHSLSRASLRGQSGQKSEFIHYESAPKERRSRINLRWAD
jgi:hypothetical protein